MSNQQIYFQRSAHNKENPYAQISRELIRDKSISPNCRWLLIYFLSMRDDFKINVKQVWNHLKDFLGRDQVYRIINEACAAGYMKREDQIVNNLKRGVIYHISEVPIEEFKKCFRRPESRDTENQEALRRSFLKKEVIKEPPISPKGESKKRSKKPPSEKIERAKDVRTTDLEHQKLLKEFGSEERVAEVYEELAIWKDSQGIAGGNDYSTARNWRLKDKPKVKVPLNIDSPEKGPQNANKQDAVEKYNWLKEQRNFKQAVNSGALKPIKIDGTNEIVGCSILDSSNRYGNVYYKDSGFKEVMLNFFRKMDAPPKIDNPDEKKT